MRKCRILLLCFLLIALLAGCQTQGDEQVNADRAGKIDVVTDGSYRAEDWNGKQIAVLSGSAFDGIIQENIPGAGVAYFNTVGDAVAAVRAGKADGLMLDDAEIKLLVATNPDFKLLEPFVTNTEYAVMVGKGNDALKASLDEFILKIKQDGTYDDMLRRWLDEAGEKPMPDIPLGSGDMLTFAMAPVVDGFTYMKNGEYAGFDIEFARRFAAHLDRKLEIVSLDFSGILPSVQSGKADFAASLIIITEERKQNVDFSIPYYIGGSAIATRKTTEEMKSVLLYDRYADKRFATLTGTAYADLADMRFSNPSHLFFNTPLECAEAVRTGKADITLADEPIAKKLAAKLGGIRLLYPPIDRCEYGMIFGKDKSALRGSFNEFLEQMKRDGTMEELSKRWLETADSPAMPDIPLSGENGTLVFASTGMDEPFSYIQNGMVAGYDIEIAYRFADYMGMTLRIELMDFSAMIPAVQSGKADFGGDLITITDERKGFIDFSNPYYIGGVVAIVEDQSSVAKLSFWENLQKSFVQNLVVENRWRMIAEGLNVTMLISICAFVLATLLGFGVCFLRMSKRGALRGIASVYINLLRGTPIVVLLMITYYIVFAKVNINSSLVAIIAFGVNGGAFIGEIVRSAILTVDRGQVEAARSMGFSKIGAFCTVTFPQAARVALPVYKSEFISMVKSTAIVGYIAIVDLTKAGDIIRSRTYDAFFPLIVVALVYLAATGILVWAFDQINRLTNKRERKKTRRLAESL